MMIGNYPCCDAPLMIVLPGCRLPVISSELCPGCGAKVWHKFSRIDPESWTDEAFLKEWKVDEETKQIKPRKAGEKM